MSVAHLNVRSVASRENMCLLKQTVTNNYFDIFTVSGSWLDPTVYDADILFRHIRLSGEIEGHNRRGGGLLVYIKNIYKACVIEKWSSVKPIFNNYG